MDFVDKRAASLPDQPQQEVAPQTIQDLVCERFIRNALKVASAKQHPAFRKSLEVWLQSMSEQDRWKFANEYQSRGQHIRKKIASDLYATFRQKQ